MGIDLYFMYGSPACHAVMMIAEAIGIALNLIPIDLSKGEHLTPDFVKVKENLIQFIGISLEIQNINYLIIR